MFNTSLECKEKEESRDEGMEKYRGNNGWIEVGISFRYI